MISKVNLLFARVTSVWKRRPWFAQWLNWTAFLVEVAFFVRCDTETCFGREWDQQTMRQVSIVLLENAAKALDTLLERACSFLDMLWGVTTIRGVVPEHASKLRGCAASILAKKNVCRRTWAQHGAARFMVMFMFSSCASSSSSSSAAPQPPSSSPKSLSLVQTVPFLKENYKLHICTCQYLSMLCLKFVNICHQDLEPQLSYSTGQLKMSPLCRTTGVLHLVGGLPINSHCPYLGSAEAQHRGDDRRQYFCLSQNGGEQKMTCCYDHKSHRKPCEWGSQSWGSLRFTTPNGLGWFRCVPSRSEYPQSHGHKPQPLSVPLSLSTLPSCPWISDST